MRCLLITNPHAADDQLRNVMEELCVEVVAIDRLHIDWLTEKLTPPADFACAILAEPADAEAEAAVFVDIGVALGREVPVFLVVAPSRKVPLVLAGLTRVDADLDNRGALELHLKQFLRSISRETPRARQPLEQSPALTPEEAAVARTSLWDLAREPRGHSARTFEHLMLNLLDSPGSQVSRPVPDAEGGWDLSLWDRGTELAIDGPVLIQLKLWDSPPRQGLITAARRFADQLATRPAPFGLLIYHVTLPGAYDIPLPVELASRIVVVSAGDLIDVLAEQPIGKVLVSMRNAMVHGGFARG